MLVTAKEMLEKAVAGHYALVSLILITLSGLKLSLQQLRSLIPLLSSVFPKVPENIWQATRP